MSSFGVWAEEFGLPVFHEIAHPDESWCTWDPVVGPPTDRHWSAFGNRRLQVVADSHGTTAIRDTAHGVRWLTPVSTGTGSTVVRTATGEWATDRNRWPSSWRTPVAPVRTWGPTWFTVTGTHDDVRIERRVICPEGEAAHVLVRVEVEASSAMVVDLVEEWCLAAGSDSYAAPFLESPWTPADSIDIRSGNNEAAVVTRAHHRRVELTPGRPMVWWSAVGLDEGPGLPDNPEETWARDLATLRRRLPTASCPRVPAVEREIPWHVALLTGGAAVDAVLGGHTLDQGSAYSFDLGFNGAARDPLQHAMPLVYSEPDLALSVLRNTCAWAGPDGELPYAIDPTKQPIVDWFDPSDQALWSLWLAAEYAAATGDLAAFRAPAPFHPIHDAPAVPLIEHLVGQFRHLVDVVGVGARGHIRIRNADWNDSALTLAPVDREVMHDHGESVLNSAMAAWVLPRFAGLLRRLGEPHLGVVAGEADQLADRWCALVADEWNGRWFRRAHGPGAVVGDDELWLEVQPWAILCGAADRSRSLELLDTIDEIVRRDSPLGARVRGPVPVRVPEGRVAGEGSAGGIWFSINMTLAWAAATVGSELAWDEFSRMTLAAHTSAYPDVWEGTLSGPDAYNAPESPRPGCTWAWPDRGIGMQTFPVANLHAHGQVVMTYLRLLGVEPAADGSLRVGKSADATFSSRVFQAEGVGPLRA